MFEWWRNRRREKVLAEPFPEAWPGIMARRVRYLRFLSPEDLKRLEDLVQVFMDEKEFEGCGGLALTDEICVTVAASACLLLLGLEHDMYRRVHSILIYPAAVRSPQRPAGFFEIASGPTPESRGLLGEAHLGGPVLLVWDAVKKGCRDARSGHNVVLHEFAHKLDMLDGEVDGTPPLRGTEQLNRWADVCSQAYLQLKARHERGKKSVMDAYGAHSEAEFFAVATETFFEQSWELREEQPALYDVLRAFYRQDPAQRSRRTV